MRRNKNQPTQKPAGPKPGGLLASGVTNRARVVLPEDRFEEPTRQAGIYKIVGDYIAFLTEGDSLLWTINEVYNNSPTTRSIIRQKATLTIGDGFTAFKGRRSGLFQGLTKASSEVVDVAELEALNDLLEQVNTEGESLLDVAYKCALEFITYGNAYFGMARTEDGVYGYNIPFVKGRVSEKKPGDVGYVGINEDWKIKSFTDGTVERLPLWPAWEKDEDGIERTVIHLKDYAPGFDYYGLPEWISALLYAELEYRISKFNSSKFDNGFMPSGLLQMFGAVSPEEAKDIVNEVHKQFTGTGKNSGLLVQVLSDETYKAVFTPFEKTNEGEFLQLSQISAQAIVSAHRWTMSLAGFATAGQLGTNEQIRMEFEIAQNSVIKPIQEMILSAVVNRYVDEVAKINLDVANIYLGFANSTPVSFLGAIDVNQVLTNDEKRELAGYGAVEVDELTDDMKIKRDTIAGFSPLLANKMLDQLSRDDIRALLGYEPDGLERTEGAEPIPGEQALAEYLNRKTKPGKR